jgi:hypothetical protein
MLSPKSRSRRRRARAGTAHGTAAREAPLIGPGESEAADGPATNTPREGDSETHDGLREWEQTTRAAHGLALHHFETKQSLRRAELEKRRALAASLARERAEKKRQTFVEGFLAERDGGWSQDGAGPTGPAAARSARRWASSGPRESPSQKGLRRSRDRESAVPLVAESQQGRMRQALAAHEAWRRRAREESRLTERERTSRPKRGTRNQKKNTRRRLRPSSVPAGIFLPQSRPGDGLRDFFRDNKSETDREVDALLSDRASLARLWQRLQSRKPESFRGVCTLADIHAFAPLVPGLEGVGNKFAVMRAFQQTARRAGAEGQRRTSVQRGEFATLLANVYYFDKLWSAFAFLQKRGARALRIDAEEFTAALRSLGVDHGYCSDAEAAHEFAELDGDGDGSILYDELCGYVAEMCTGVHPALGAAQDDGAAARGARAAARRRTRARDERPQSPEPLGQADIDSARVLRTVRRTSRARAGLTRP